jgi:hypothetical protein
LKINNNIKYVTRLKKEGWKRRTHVEGMMMNKEDLQ